MKKGTFELMTQNTFREKTKKHMLLLRMKRQHLTEAVSPTEQQQPQNFPFMVRFAAVAVPLGTKVVSTASAYNWHFLQNFCSIFQTSGCPYWMYTTAMNWICCKPVCSTLFQMGTDEATIATLLHKRGLESDQAAKLMQLCRAQSDKTVVEMEPDSEA